MREECCVFIDWQEYLEGTRRLCSCLEVILFGVIRLMGELDLEGPSLLNFSVGSIQTALSNTNIT